MWKPILLTLSKIVGGLLVSGVVLGISVPMLGDRVDAWLVWLVTIVCVVGLLWGTRPRHRQGAPRDSG